MKKQVKKLLLAKETLRNLHPSELEGLGAGETLSQVWYCFGTWAGCTSTVPPQVTT